MAVAAAVIIFWGVRSLAFILAPLAMAMVITIAILPLPGWFIEEGREAGPGAHSDHPVRWSAFWP